MTVVPDAIARRRPRINLVRSSVFAVAVLTVGSWGYLVFDQGARPGELLSSETIDGALRFLRELLGIDQTTGAEETPAFLDAARWREVGGLAIETLAMSVLAIGIAAIGMLLTVVPAARPHPDELRSTFARVVRGVVFVALRAIYVVTRAIPELVWALLIVFVLSPGVLAGALALGIHNFGILGKLGAEVVEDLDPRPARALRASGARSGHVLLYAVLPQALPQFLTYILYRWEVIIRTTIVVGFVAAGGLGREFRLAMSFFHYTDIALLLLVYFMLVLAVDAISAGLRRLAR